MKRNNNKANKKCLSLLDFKILYLNNKRVGRRTVPRNNYYPKHYCTVLYHPGRSTTATTATTTTTRATSRY